MEENRKRQQVLIIAAITTFALAIIGASYAYFSTNTNVESVLNTNVGTAGATYSFSAESKGDMNLSIAFSDMSETGATNAAVKSASAEVDITLLNPSADGQTVCTYDIVWIWDSKAKYDTPDTPGNKLPYTADDGRVYNYEFSSKVDTDIEMDLSALEKYDNGQNVILKKNATLTATGTTAATKKHTITTAIYNLPVKQSSLYGKEFAAHISVDHVKCTMTS